MSVTSVRRVRVSLLAPGGDQIARDGTRVLTLYGRLRQPDGSSTRPGLEPFTGSRLSYLPGGLTRVTQRRTRSGAGRAAAPGSSGQVWTDPAPTPSIDSERRSTTPRRPNRLHLVRTLTGFRLGRGASCKPLHFNPAACTL